MTIKQNTIIISQQGINQQIAISNGSSSSSWDIGRLVGGQWGVVATSSQQQQQQQQQQQNQAEAAAASAVKIINSEQKPVETHKNVPLSSNGRNELGGQEANVGYVGYAHCGSVQFHCNGVQALASPGYDDPVEGRSQQQQEQQQQQQEQHEQQQQQQKPQADKPLLIT
ncbi:hypothetical protein AWZ03_005083 [Drosophila navojoa]|uniref:Uncharacterized protein n=1 Tax=Drosophila navojoa TaxID=7232 RepID=A0A484BIC1_DRONA|nr:hypothetical protein AWZ03_005083 [Drosophila navojoa]